MPNAMAIDENKQEAGACQMLEAAILALDLAGLTTAAALASAALDEALATVSALLE
jgi:hypothetical protein